MVKTSRIALFLKLFLLNVFFLGAGYFLLRRFIRFSITIIFFASTLCLFIFGFPLEGYSHAPYQMMIAFPVILAIDAAFLAIKTKENNQVTFNWAPYIIATLVTLFCIQWSSLWGYQHLARQNLVTTNVFVLESSDMMPQLRTGDIIVARAWAWRPVVLGEIGLQRGDVIVQKDSGTTVIRRIVALPDETMTMHNGVVVINGKPFETNPVGTIDFPTEKGIRNGILLKEIMPSGRLYEVITKEHLKIDKDAVNSVFTIPPEHVGVMSDSRPVILSPDYEKSLVVPLKAILARPIYSIDASRIQKPIF